MKKKLAVKEEKLKFNSDDNEEKINSITEIALKKRRKKHPNINEMFTFRKEFSESLTNPDIPPEQTEIILNIPQNIRERVIKESELTNKRNALFKELNHLGKTLHKSKQFNLNTYYNLGEILFYINSKTFIIFKRKKYDFIEIYSRRYVDKLIKFYNFIYKYPIILKSTFPFHKIINNIKILEEILSIENGGPKNGRINNRTRVE